MDRIASERSPACAVETVHHQVIEWRGTETLRLTAGQVFFEIFQLEITSKLWIKGIKSMSHIGMLVILLKMIYLVYFWARMRVYYIRRVFLFLKFNVTLRCFKKNTCPALSLVALKFEYARGWITFQYPLLLQPWQTKLHIYRYQASRSLLMRYLISLGQSYGKAPTIWDWACPKTHSLGLPS